MELDRILERVASALRERGIAHALIGGLALAAHGAARATLDVDLLAPGERAEEVDELLRAQGYRCLHRSEFVANYASDEADLGRVDFLFARRAYGRAMLARAETRPEVAGGVVPVVDAADLIGLKVQAYSNDPRRRHADLADIQRLLEVARDVDLERVREYFRVFDREKELEALLEQRGSR